MFYLLRYACGREDMENQWVFDRCREVQASPDGHLDLWAREHYKSTIITFGLTLQDILKDPEVTVGIFSHTRGIAKAFLRQIKRELEINDRLKEWFPEVLWQNPAKDAPKWSEDDGLIVRREGNPKEATVEAWGLVDSQPTSRHFRLMIYDDVVVKDSVGTPEQIAKVTEAWELSRNLGAENGRTRYNGTRYHYNDTYSEMLRRKVAVPRLYPATADGKMTGEPVLLTRDRLEVKRREMGPYTFGCQMLMDPKADETQGFKEDWLRFYNHKPEKGGKNIYILVDPASEKKKDSDYTAMWVVGLAQDGNYYALDFHRDRLNLVERANLLFRLHRQWKAPKSTIKVGYEKYGMMADIEHMRDRMDRENYRFDIIELGGPMPKNDRIRRLIPIFEQGQMWLPKVMRAVNWEGNSQELTQIFIDDEYRSFPFGVHDDMLDALARILDEKMETVWPRADPLPDRYSRKSKRQTSSWAA